MTKKLPEAHAGSMFLRTYGALGTLVERLCKDDTDLLRLVALGPDGTAHFIAAIASRRREAMEAEPAFWAQRLAHVKRIALLEESFGPIPIGYLNALGRCGPEVLPPRHYETLRLALFDDRYAAMLYHHRRIRAPMLALLDSPEADCFGVELLGDVRCNSMDAVGSLLDALRARFTKRRHFDPAFAIPRFATAEELELFLAHEHGVGFPTAPWPGDEFLRPVRDGVELTRLAKEMENCLESYIEAALYGDCVFYRTVDHPPIVVRLTRDVGGIWAVAEMEGAGNGDRSHNKVRRHLASAGIRDHSGLGDLRDVRRVIGRVFGTFEHERTVVIL